MTERALADASYVEINRRKERVGSDLSARAYFYDPSKSFLISSVSGCYEVDEPSVLPESASHEVLGRVVCDHLLRFEVTTPKGLNLRKMTEWPVFVASGARSVTNFQSHSWSIDLTTVGDNSIRIDVSPMKSLAEIAVSGVARPKHEQVGSLIRSAIRGAVTLRKEGVI